ncbi:MAG: translation initiation factor IF-2, partial [Bacteroidetes bacterium]|nr:translation initiation factor IF-2 [Bacteroidota bacterium]
ESVADAEVEATADTVAEGAEEEPTADTAEAADQETVTADEAVAAEDEGAKSDTAPPEESVVAEEEAPAVEATADAEADEGETDAVAVEAEAADTDTETVDAEDVEAAATGEPTRLHRGEAVDALDSEDIDTVDELEDEDEIADRVLKADRYKLEGTKVLGKVDLSKVDDDRGKRKRKRKRKRKAASAKGNKVKFEDRGKKKSSSKKKGRKKKKKVDEEDVEQTLQETLRELEHGAQRVRQQRRKQRRERHAEERERELQEAKEQEQVLEITEYVSTGELANLMGEPVNDVIEMLFSSGMMVSINQRLDADTIQYVADEFGYEVEFIDQFDVADIQLEEDDPEDLEPRPPVVTVMGHVDHGKTSLLDYMRKADVVAGEAGGITQHIGAYTVQLEDGAITFLDTPGHEAFTAMRARGAKATDIVILVVAANDSVMPQTVEAINHAKAAEVPMVVAINKMDLPEADAQKVMQELAEEGVLVEPYGGKVQCAQVSAETGEGIDDLIEKVLLEADLREFQANPNRRADGVVIESRLEKGRGNVATILVKNGTLHVGDPFVAGMHSGRIRAMFDERDNRVDEVGPSEPALILGLSGSPEVGDQFVSLDDEGRAREIAQRRQQIYREQSIRQQKRVTLDDISRRMALGEFQELNLIVKGDVGGSVEALSDALLKLRTDEVAVNIIHTGVGAISESDVMLASASNAVILGFQVRPTTGARSAAQEEEIDVRTYSIIYNAIQDVHDALEGMLSPETSEETVGIAEVRDIFKVPKAGTVAGCYVTEGRINRNDNIRLVRDGVVVYEGEIDSLRRFKEDVREVQTSFECGLGIKNFNDIKSGDVIEAYKIVEEKRTLEV